MLKPGLYEQVISKNLAQIIENDTENLKVTTPIDNEEASKILSKYLEEIIVQGLENIKDNGGSIVEQVNFINRIVDTIANETG